MKTVGIIFGAAVIAVIVICVQAPRAAGEIGDCPAGYEFQPSSGVGCVQINCNDVENGHWSYTSACICGSAGSIYEDPTDPNKGCYYDRDYAACPGCLYACVHTDEACPDETPPTTNTNASSNVNASVNTNAASTNSASGNTNQLVNQNSNTSLTTAGVGSTASCTEECNKYLRGKRNASVVSATGEPPDCACQIDVQAGGAVTQTIKIEGPIETTYTFDPSSGALLSRVTVNRRDEIEKIRKRLGYRYTEAEIDALLAPEKIDAWFQSQTQNIRTTTNLLNPQFWWQHVVAILDHGFDGNSADFVDTYQFGRCGDSMQWLERDLSGQLRLGDDADEPGQKHEAMLSITGEKYGNMLNHTSLLIRPAGITNAEWEDIVRELKQLSGGTEDNPGIQPGGLQNIDPRLLDAKVLDPYKKQITTVREFIKGWSYIRIS
ncbi:MAG: hypothetical protein HZC01_04180 [Candidatus Kerfeldbacteria bacterium]|nr:hypothetical protein [Candidatus Kerfeldbacteria bacterium]